MSQLELTPEEEELLVDIALTQGWRVRDQKEYASLTRKGLIVWSSSKEDFESPKLYLYILTSLGEVVSRLIGVRYR